MGGAVGTSESRSKGAGGGAGGGGERCTFLTHLGSFQVRISGPVFGIPTGDNSEPCRGISDAHMVHFRRGAWGLGLRV